MIFISLPSYSQLNPIASSYSFPFCLPLSLNDFCRWPQNAQWKIKSLLLPPLNPLIKNTPTEYIQRRSLPINFNSEALFEIGRTSVFDYASLEDIYDIWSSHRCFHLRIRVWDLRGISKVLELLGYEIS